MSHNFFFSINTQFENLGDALINRELIKESSRHGRVYVDISRCPSEFVHTLNISNFENVILVHGFFSLLLRIVKLRVIGEPVFYFLNPGGLGQKLTFRQRISALIYNLILLGFNILGVKVCHVGISFSELNPVDLIFAKVRSKLCFRVYPRDKLSFDYMKSNGFNVHGVYPDLSFYIEGCSRNCNGNSIVVSFRFDSEYLSDYEKVVNFLEVQFLKYSGYRVVFLSQVQRDDEKMKRLYEYFLSYSGMSSIYVPHGNDLDSVFSLYSKSDVVFSNRLHVLLMAGLSGCYPIACLTEGSGSKIRGLFSDLNMSSLVCNIDDVSNININQDVDFYSIFYRQRELVRDLFQTLCMNKV